jgi:hypothetical protein
MINGEIVQAPPGSYNAYGRHTTGTIFDSGTTFTYLNSQIYNAVVGRFDSI